MEASVAIPFNHWRVTYDRYGSGLISANAGRSLQGSTGPKNVPCSIDVGVVTVTALKTSNLLLIYPVSRVDVVALGTRLAGIARIHAHYCPTGTLSLVGQRSEEHTSELQSLRHLVCRLLLE